MFENMNKTKAYAYLAGIFCACMIASNILATRTLEISFMSVRNTELAELFTREEGRLTYYLYRIGKNNFSKLGAKIKCAFSNFFKL